MKPIRIGATSAKSRDFKNPYHQTLTDLIEVYLPTKKDIENNFRSTTKGSSYSKEEIEFICTNYLKYSDEELATLFGRTLNAISALRSRHGLNRDRKPPFKVTLRNAIREAQLMRETWAIVQDMKALIIICQLNINHYKKEQYKKELLKLSNFNLTKIKPLKC